MTPHPFQVRKKLHAGDRAEHKNGNVCRVLSIIENTASVEFEDGRGALVSVAYLTWLPLADMRADRVREMEKQMRHKRGEVGPREEREGLPHTAAWDLLAQAWWD